MRRSLRVRKPPRPETVQVQCGNCQHLGNVIKRWVDEGHPGPCPECGAADYGAYPGYDDLFSEWPQAQ